MRIGKSDNVSVAGIEAADEIGNSTKTEMPAGFRYLGERERAQKISLQKLFAEQEHGLRQKYADWIIWLLGAQSVIADAVFVAFAWAGRS